MGAASRSAERFAQRGEMTVSQTAKRLKIGESTVLRLLKEDRESWPRLNGTKRHGAWFVAKSEVEALLERYPNFAGGAA